MWLVSPPLHVIYHFYWTEVERMKNLKFIMHLWALIKNSAHRKEK